MACFHLIFLLIKNIILCCLSLHYRIFFAFLQCVCTLKKLFRERQEKKFTTRQESIQTFFYRQSFNIPKKKTFLSSFFFRLQHNQVNFWPNYVFFLLVLCVLERFLSRFWILLHHQKLPWNDNFSLCQIHTILHK